MGVKRTWQLTKLASLSIPSELREQILNDLTRRNTRRIRVYAWRVNESHAEYAFLTKSALIREWARVNTKRLLHEDAPETLQIVEWDICLKDLPKYIHDKQLTRVPLNTESMIYSSITPFKTLIDDILTSIPRISGMSTP